jgi:hypothetical protein
MRIYLSGPMRNRPAFNFPEFDKARDRAVALGHTVISPADMDRAVGFHGQGTHNYDYDLSKAILRDLTVIATCDAIALLPDWEKSAGVTVELALAQFLGLKVLCADTFEPMPTAHVGAI